MKLGNIAKRIISESAFPSSVGWTDGKTLKIDSATGNPVGVEFIGDIKSPSDDAPKADDWRSAPLGKDEHIFWSPKLNKAFKSTVARMMIWNDGVRVDMDQNGNPVGYKYLGWLNSGIKLPQAKDWRQFYYTSRGHEKTLSPSLKVWYEVDSGD